MMDIYRAQKIAEDRAVDPEWDKSFRLVGLGGEIKCKWLDPYFGIFQIEGDGGLVMVKQVPPELDCIMDVEEAK